MPTSGAEIKGFIIKEIEKYTENFVMNDNLDKLVTCIAEGVYKGMQKLDDISGTPASTGHQ